MKVRARSARWLSLACTATLVAACQLPGAPVAGPAKDHSVSANAFGNVTINVNGRTFRVRTDDEQAVTKMSVMAAGNSYEVKEGSLQLPAPALNHAKQYGKGFFTILAQGYSPKQVWIGQVGDEIMLNHVQTRTLYPSMGVSGGTLKTPDRAVTVTIPPNMVAQEGTNVALSEYTPAITPEDEDAFLTERNDFIGKLKGGGIISAGGGNIIAAGGGNIISAGGGNYRVAQAKSEACDENDGLPCALDESMGFLVTADGLLKPGKMTILLDMNAMLDVVDRAGSYGGNVGHEVDGDGYRVLKHKARHKGQGSKRSRAAKQVLDVIHDMDALYGEAWRDLLYRETGVQVLGTSYISFPINIGQDAVQNGSVVSVVEGLKLFGVKMEVTVVSSLSSMLPPIASLPDMVALTPANFINSGGNLISNNSAALIANNGGGLIANNGGGLIANNSAGVVSNNGGTLIGNVRVPFLPEGAKYKVNARFGLLAGLPEYDWPGGARIRAVDEAGTPLTDWAVLDAQGQYKLSQVPAIAGLVFLECEAADLSLRTLAPQPAPNSLARADINTVTTSVTSLVRDRITGGTYGVEDVSAGTGFEADGALIRSQIDLSEAKQVVTSDIPNAAAITARYLTDPASLAQPVLKKLAIKVLEMPDHPKAAKGLAAVTGLSEDAFEKGRTTDVVAGYTFQGGHLEILARGYGDALDVPPSYQQPLFDPDTFTWFFPGQQQKWRLLAQAEPLPEEGAATEAAAPEPTPTPRPTPTPPPAMQLPPDLPQGPVRLLYTAEVERGSGEKAQYQFQISVSNYTLLEFAGRPLPLKVNLLEPRRVPGALLGNYWNYVGDGK
ncbi:MAG: DUF1565 domain-containing protein [Candidatus Sericytochromatia bacterium]